jgi:hypothetical protein
MAAKGREEIQPDFEPLAVGEGRIASRLGNMEPVDREATPQQLNVDPIDTDRSLGDCPQLRDRHSPRQRR